MKILIIAHINELGGWADAAIEYALALDAIGYDVVIRSVNLTGQIRNHDPKIQSFLCKDLQNVDICIQIVLPHHFEYSNKFKKNIGICFTETDSIAYTGWIERINLLDSVIVAAKSSQFCLEDSGVTVPVYTVPIPCDITQYNKEYPKINLPTGDDFIFYFIGEFNRRKNLSALLKAFHLEFNKSESVSLVIKTSKFGISAQDLAKQVEQFCLEIKKGLKLYSNPSMYKDELIITSHMSKNELFGLHQRCDCFVSATHGEGYGLTVRDAMAFGKFPIVTSDTAMDDFIDNAENGFLVNSYNESCWGIFEPFHFLYSGKENWRAIDIESLSSTMRFVYTKRPIPNLNKPTDCMQQFSYKNIGQQLKGIIEHG